MKKICAVCNKEFETNYSKKIYCSSVCKKLGSNKQHQEYKKSLTEKGLCRNCGSKIEKDRLGRTLCLSCSKLSYQKEKNKYEGLNINILCNKDCFNCIYEDCILEDNVSDFRKNKIERSKKYRIVHNEKCKNKDKERYKYRKENKLCVKCGKPLIDFKYVLCQDCKNKDKDRQTKNRRENGMKSKQEDMQDRLYRKENGFCWFCGKPALEGKKTCKFHHKLYKEHWKKHLKPILDEKNKN